MYTSIRTHINPVWHPLEIEHPVTVPYRVTGIPQKVIDAQLSTPLAKRKMLNPVFYEYLGQTQPGGTGWRSETNNPHPHSRTYTVPTDNKTIIFYISNRGLVVEFSPATRETRVRFSAVAFFPIGIVFCNHKLPYRLQALIDRRVGRASGDDILTNIYNLLWGGR